MNEQERIQAIQQQENMTAKDFAREIGISQATMSNILSGRNNPSLDVMQKVLARFRMVSTEWLILGVGSMYRQKNEATEPLLFDMRPEEKQEIPENPGALGAPVAPGIPAAPEKAGKKETGNSQPAAQVIMKEKKIQKIVVFYDDGTYEEK